MTNAVVDAEVALLIEAYDPDAPEACADGLRELWLQFEPGSIGFVKAEERELQETVGIPVPVLKSIGKEVAKTARRRVPDYVPLVRLLWDRYGREGRVVALITLGAMELTAPDCIVPLLKEMCRTCITWEDADRLAMDALEPIVRKKPEEWLTPIEPWLDDQSKWVRRAGVIVVGRLPMKHPAYAERCVRLCERLLLDSEVDVKKAVSFAIRLTARGDVEPVRGLLRQHVPPDDPSATWVLCDTIRSMARKLLPEFVSLLPIYEGWAADSALSTKDRRSVESAVRVLRQAQT
jgi:3-methyladenine DNA glycosylase AlkD